MKTLQSILGGLFWPLIIGFFVILIGLVWAQETVVWWRALGTDILLLMGIGFCYWLLFDKDNL